MRASNLAVATALALTACFIGPTSLKAESAGKTLSGRASWYGPGFHGRRTASGETFNTNALTAAHRTLPFGAKVRVVNKRTGRSVVVRINDRGPYAHGRIIDLSRAAAKAIGLAGVADVAIAQL
jgi:rare lipoprotein A